MEHRRKLRLDALHIPTSDLWDLNPGPFAYKPTAGITILAYRRCYTTLHVYYYEYTVLIN